MKKSKLTLIIVVILIFLVLLILLINVARKTYILSKIINTSQEVSQSENYYWNLKLEGKELSTYRKGEKALTIITEDSIKTTYFKNGETSNIYTESSEGKTAKLNEKTVSGFIEIPVLLTKDGIEPIFINAMQCKISDVTEDGKECYLIESSANDFIIHSSIEKTQLYIDKETGLTVKLVEYDNNGKLFTTNYKYEFNTVTDEDLKEPNINNYKVE